MSLLGEGTIVMRKHPNESLFAKSAMNVCNLTQARAQIVLSKSSWDHYVPLSFDPEDRFLI